MKMMSPYFHRGRLLVHNFYTSVPLAEKLLQKKIYILGTLRKNVRSFPCLKNMKLERGHLMTPENENRVVYIPWQDTRFVQMLSTKLKLTRHYAVLILRLRQNQLGNQNVSKPSFVKIDNETKQVRISECTKFKFYKSFTCRVFFSLKNWFIGSAIILPELPYGKQFASTTKLSSNYYLELLCRMHVCYIIQRK